MKRCQCHAAIRLVVCAVLFVLSSPSLVSQTMLPSEPLRLNVDYARFRGDEKNAYVEVYYSFPQRSLTFKSDGDAFKGGIELGLMVVQRDSMVYGERWIVPHTITDTSALVPGMNLVGITNVGLAEGEYILKMVGKDKNNPSRRDSVNLRLPVKVVGSEGMAVSDIEFASNIKQKGDKASPFYKNTLEVIPSPEGIYSEDKKCFFYLEAYNLLGRESHGDYLVKTVVVDAVGREVFSRERTKKRSAESAVLVDNIGVDQLKSGTYSLFVGLLDSSNKVITSTGKKFFVYNRALGFDSTLAASTSSGSFSEYAGVDEPELDREFDWAKYEANEVEKSQFKSLTSVDGKRKFLADFWRRRPLAYKQEYLKRVAYANSTLGVPGRKGFQTDRGRVYIMYGPPDDIERHPSESNSRPYEVWTFNNIQGGVIFAFVQRASGGDYELVHSTHRNELHDENWMRFAQTQ